MDREDNFVQYKQEVFSLRMDKCKVVITLKYPLCGYFSSTITNTTAGAKAVPW